MSTSQGQPSAAGPGPSGAPIPDTGPPEDMKEAGRKSGGWGQTQDCLILLTVMEKSRSSQKKKV